MTLKKSILERIINISFVVLYSVLIYAAFYFIIIEPYIINKDINVPTGFSCYNENAILLRQYISNTTYSGGGSCLNGCLFMDVYTEHYSFMPCGHIEKVSWLNLTYYFADESIRTDLMNGDNIIVTWCYIDENIGRRIRGIKKNDID